MSDNDNPFRQMLEFDLPREFQVVDQPSAVDARPGVDLLLIPKGSLVVFRGLGDAEHEWLDQLVANLRQRCGHDQFVVVSLPVGADLSVVHDPEAMERLLSWTMGRATVVGGGMPMQADCLAWVRARWPERCTPIYRAAKLAEEAGETIGAVIKSEDGDGRKSWDDVAQETAQVVICAMALAESVGFDLWTQVVREYARCQTRTWRPS